MKYISIGLQCSVTNAIRDANLREYGYPFDWSFSPSKTTYNILNILINDSIENTIEYIINDYSYYILENKEFYRSVNYITNNKINKNTGLGIVHYDINDNYINSLKRRFQRLLNDIKSNENLTFIYSDAASPDTNYYLDGIEYGLDATEYLLKIYHLLFPINNNIKILYFCWNNRKKENNIIEYIPFEYKNSWEEVTGIITNYLVNSNK
jgi:hypothetical protein